MNEQEKSEKLLDFLVEKRGILSVELDEYRDCIKHCMADSPNSINVIFEISIKRLFGIINFLEIGMGYMSLMVSIDVTESNVSVIDEYNLILDMTFYVIVPEELQ